MAIEELIRQAVQEHIDCEEISVSKEVFNEAVKGVIYWYNISICEAVSDSLTSAITKNE
ncbi:hypothetical protein [Cytobacillus oceanisediminis]|uniref:hypothetical protein n=1 Tax=Cytobacillus oceanisediminis TaxID=665099 RepID=UPI00203D7A4D|nr:hypothetical protein [Cytobacillus oceanisediminis]MCM3405493.1 hypothetical protein [Cytobacillus oceanisediminis]